MSIPLPPVWPISSVVIFDCDSTLTSTEGIDELARIVSEERGPDRDSPETIAVNIARLTKRAMEGDIPLEAIYRERLAITNPTQAQVRRIAQIYRDTAIPDARAVIEALQGLGTLVFIVSGGLIEPVRDFGVWLGVPREHIFAVDMEYDQLAGQWWRYWDQPGGQNPQMNYLAVTSNPLTSSLGKNRVIARIRTEHGGRAMLVGDGLSDLEAGSEVDLFVGFGGAAYRERIAESAPIYMHSLFLSPILPLALGRAGSQPRFAPLWAEGLGRLQAGEVTFKEDALQASFYAAMRGTLAP